MYAGERQFRSECCQGGSGAQASNLGLPAIPDPGPILEDIADVLDDIPLVGDLFGGRARAGGRDPCTPDAPMPVYWKGGNEQPPGAPQPPGRYPPCEGADIPCQGGRTVAGDVPVQSVPNRDDIADCIPLEHPQGSGRYWVYRAQGATSREQAQRQGKWIEVTEAIRRKAANGDGQRDPAPGGNGGGGNGVVRAGLPGWAVPVGLGALALLMSDR